MNRTAAVALLTKEYRELATEVKFTSQQTTDAYDVAIDMSLRWLGFQESQLAAADVVQADTLKYIALLHYYALKRFERILALKYDVELPGPLKAARNQAFKAVQALLEDAKGELAVQGIDIDGSQSSYGIGYLNLDFLEPSCSGSEF